VVRLLGALVGLVLSVSIQAAPYTPADDSKVLAIVPAGARHTELSARDAARGRLDVALPLAQLYITRARSSGDLRYLGYAQAVLSPWTGPSAASPDALVLYATVLQSRHEFSRALSVLDRARALRPGDPQAWLTTATVLRVLGRYDESLAACEEVARGADQVVAELCRQSARALMGELPAAYARVVALPSHAMSNMQRAWRDSELGEMAERLGRDAEAEHWFSNGLRFAPDDFYILAAYADLLLRNGRAREVLILLRGRDGLEPLLLRIAIAQKALHEPGLVQSRARLAGAFAAEAQRGDGVHRREEARFLLEVERSPRAALVAAQGNWEVQHEVEDVLVLVRAARQVGQPEAAAPALAFVREHGLEDVRLRDMEAPRA